MSVTLHTDVGDLKLELFCESVPKTAENFLALCASAFYDGSPIHRNLTGFMFQTGSPSSDPKSKTSTSIYPSADGQNHFADEIRPGLRHSARGIVSMANKGPNTNGSQFFVTYAAAAHLDGKNTVFGKAIDGWDTLDTLEKLEVDKKGRPKEKVRIKNVTIHANPLAG